MVSSKLATEVDKSKVKDKNAALVEDLERRTLRQFDLVNQRDFAAFKDLQNSSPSTHFSSDFTVDVDGMDASLTYPEFCVLVQDLCEAFPDYTATVEKLSTEIVDDAETAIIAVEFEHSGWPPGVRRRSFVIHTWKRREGNWVCIHHGGVRGGGPFDGI